jgi:hypothetical protein
MPDPPVVKEAKAAIDKVFADTSVPYSETADRLRDLQEYIALMRDAVEPPL